MGWIMKGIGLDIGTTTVSAVVADEKGRTLDSVVLRNESFLKGENFERIQDPAKIERIAMQALGELTKRHPDVCCTGLTGQMHGVLYLNGEGEPVSPLYTWQDGRGDRPCSNGKSWAKYLSELTGYPLATGYGMVTHAYNRSNGLVPEDAAVFCTIQDYLAMKLAGLKRPKTDASDAASMGLYDGRRGCFDEAAMAAAGIDIACVPEIAREPYLSTGELGLPVYVGIGDNQASFIGACGGRTDAPLLNVGTGGQISVYTDAYLTTPALDTRPFPDGGWLLVGAPLCGGRSYALLEGFFRQVYQMMTGEEQSAYPAMSRMLDEQPPVEDIPDFVTLFQGTRRNPGLRGSISNLSTDNFTPLHFMYGMMHGMANELRAMYDDCLNAGCPRAAEMIGSGNGLRKNPHLQRVFGQVFGCRLLLSENEEEAACGAALYAMKHFDD